ncbi:MAG: serine--tRNA ligase [Gammaproteobacteria bacterium]|nr:serine--tRNA ligase [Gammaproteobacteria bacterium]MCY4274634.1 serine--tRNA ligase [Gammaproteobacteria bacterium]
MLDPKLFRQELDELVEKLKWRGYAFDVDQYQSLENRRKSLQEQTEELQALRNRISKEIGIAKSKNENVKDLMHKVSTLGDEIKLRRSVLSEVQSELQAVLSEIPNQAHESVPLGMDEESNIEVRQWGSKREVDFTFRDHVDLGESLGMMDYGLASKLSGSRFVVLSGSLAGLHRALAQFMLDTHIRDHGYCEVNVPLLVNQNTLFGTGQLPKFEEDQFKTPEDPPLYLIPTAEVPLTNSVAARIVEDSELPMRLVAHTACFRREAGSYGRDTRGMIRQHQFEKVELVHAVRPDESYDALEIMTGHAETILQKLELPYRVITLCTGDMGFAASKTYDIEVWLPSQQLYREISSCSNTEDFQARRMKARWRNPATGKPELLHTLNGSGVAVGRALIGVMENYQNEDGSITIPEVLRPYMHGKTRLKK